MNRLRVTSLGPLVAACSVALVPARAVATDYYVSASGDDANAGTSPTDAWRTTVRVNAAHFAAGDRILFEGGFVFEGGISLGADDAGTTAAPVVIGGYGIARPILHATTGAGVSVYNAGGVRIEHIDVTSASGNDADGVTAYMDLPGGVHLESIAIDDVHVSGFGRNGIVIGSWSGRSGFRHVTITNCIARQNALAGIATYGEYSTTTPGYAHEDVVIRNCRAEENPGIAGRTTNTGSGIVLGQVDGATIERCVARANGALNTAVGGPIGIWAWDSNAVTIQFNESYDNRTNSTADGGGFDLDGGVTNSVMQYNYSHGNDGAGFLFAQFPGARPFGHNVARYNVSESDGQRNSYGALHFWSDGANEIHDSEVYGNTFYVSPGSGGTAAAVHIEPHSVHAVSIRNNVFVTTGGLPLIDTGPEQELLAIQGNAWWSSEAVTNYRVEGMSYASLDAFRTGTSFEQIDGMPTGLEVDPRFVAAGGGGTIGDAAMLDRLDAYRLRSDSPLIDRGLDLRARFAIDPGARDFYGTAIPQGAGFDIGASEFVATVPDDAGADVLDASVDQFVIRDATTVPDGSSSPMDASRDVSAIVDVGSEAGTPTSTHAGCGCTVPERDPASADVVRRLLATWLLALLALPRRRSKRGSAPAKL